MPIIRASKESGDFTQISNICIYDERLSGTAKAILLYMLSRPDDWQFYEDEIASHFKDGIRAVRSGIKMLIEYGYINRCKRRKGGCFQGYEYTVYENPAEMRFSHVGGNVEDCTEMTKRKNGECDLQENHVHNLLHDNPTVLTFCENAKRENAKQHTTNTNITNTDSTNKENNNGAACAAAHHYNGSPNGEHTRFYTLKEAKDIGGMSSSIIEFLAWYGRLYKLFKKKEHPRLTEAQIRKVHDNLFYYYGDYSNKDNADMDALKSSAIIYFRNVKKCDHNINHFATDGILEMRGYEWPYQEVDESLFDL